MFCNKKSDTHEDGEETGEPVKIDFAWIVFVGMQIGYSEKEISGMYYGKWNELFEQFKFYHNAKMKRVIFEKRKIASLLDM